MDISPKNLSLLTHRELLNEYTRITDDKKLCTVEKHKNLKIINTYIFIPLSIEVYEYIIELLVALEMLYVTHDYIVIIAWADISEAYKEILSLSRDK